MADKRWDLVPKLRYDTKAIISRVNFPDAFQMYTGTPFPSAGNTSNVKCFDKASHKNGDKNPSMHCYSDHCRCYACAKNFTVFDFAAEAKGLTSGSDFPKLCEEICKDFGIDLYVVSNLAEREQAIRQVFGKDQQEQQEYREYFTFTPEELEVIGLFEKKRQEIKYDVPAVDYYCLQNNCSIEDLPKRAKSRCYNEDGSPVMIQASHEEAVKLGVIPEGYSQGQIINGHEYLPERSLRELWNADKELVETMIADKCGEMTERMGVYIEQLQKLAQQYRDTHNIREERAFVSKCNAQKTANPNFEFSSAQRVRLSAYFDYTSDCDKIETYRSMMKKIESVYDKLNSLQTARAEHEDQTNSGRKNGYPDLD